MPAGFIWVAVRANVVFRGHVILVHGEWRTAGKETQTDGVYEMDRLKIHKDIPFRQTDISETAGPTSLNGPVREFGDLSPMGDASAHF